MDSPPNPPPPFPSSLPRLPHIIALLRHNLQGQNLDPAHTEAEVLQFIA